MPDLYRFPDGTHVNTQAEAKADGRPWEKVNVPTPRRELLAYLNETAAMAAMLVLPPPPPHQPPAPADSENTRRAMVAQLRGLEADEIEERILASKGPVFGRYLSAAVDRLGELRRDGWMHFRGTVENALQVKGAPAYGAATERGLRYLALAQIRDLDVEEPPQ